MKLSVFSGGFGLEAAEAVAGGGLSLLRSLANKSLLLTHVQGRYDLHDLTRQYAAEKLHESVQEGLVYQQHLQTFLDLAITAEPQLYGPDAIVWFKRLAAEQDNFRTALSYAIRTQQVQTMNQMVIALWWFWFRRGYWREAQRWLAQALERTPEASPQRCHLLLGQTNVTALLGSYHEAMPYLMEALTLARELQAYEPLVYALLIVGQATPDTDQALSAYQEAEAILLREDVARQPWVTAYLHDLVGDRLRESGHYEEAADRYRQSLTLLRQMGNVDSIAYPLGNLGRVALRNGDLENATALITESVALSQAIGNRPGLADWLLRLATVYLYHGDTITAESHLQHALDLYNETGSHRGRAETSACLALVMLTQSDTERADQYIRDSLTLYHQGWQRGRAGNLALAGQADHFVPDFVDALLIAGLIDAAQWRYERAANLLAVGKRLAEQTGHQPDQPLMKLVNDTVSKVKNQLTQRAYQAACAAGADWTLEPIFSFILT